MLVAVDMIRLGRGEQNTVDLAPEDLRQPRILSGAKRLQYLTQSAPEIGDGGQAVVKRRHQIDQYDLPV